MKCDCGCETNEWHHLKSCSNNAVTMESSLCPYHLTSIGAGAFFTTIKMLKEKAPETFNCMRDELLQREEDEDVKDLIKTFFETVEKSIK